MSPMVFYFLRQKVKFQIFADYAYAPGLSEIKDICAKFQENLIIYRDLHALITFENIGKKYDFSVLINITLSTENHKLKTILKIDTKINKLYDR